VKLIRPVLAATVLASVLLVVPGAGAAAKPCKLMTDAPGDAVLAHSRDTLFPVDLSPAPVVVPAPAGLPAQNIGPNADAMDITSADIATDKRSLTAVIRVKKLALTAPADAPSGLTWQFEFVADLMEWSVAAHTDPAGEAFFDGAYTNPLTGQGALVNGITGKLDLAKNEVRITAPLSIITAKSRIKAGSKITGMAARTGNELVIRDKTQKALKGATFEWAPISRDTASTTKAYVAMSVNCVAPGK
jgi:predicted secreted protein